MGLQQKEDVSQRLIDIWATGEASASLGFESARIFDQFDPIEKEKEKIFADQGITGGRAQMKALRKVNKEALDYLKQSTLPKNERDDRFETLKEDTLVQYVVMESLANVLCPAGKLWNTGYGANMMREAVSLMGGYGITEDCPGFLGHKWMDTQLEATYEGPEAVQRLQLSVTMTHEIFLEQFRMWIREMRLIASDWPGTGACTLGTAMELWLWTLEHLQNAKDAKGSALYHSKRHGVTFPLADALCWILAARHLILDVLELESKGPDNPVVAEGLEGLINFYTDLCHVQAAKASGEVGRICAELVFGYNLHPAWDEETCQACFQAEELEELDQVMPGIGSCASAFTEVTGENESHPAKAGPCVRFEGLEKYSRLRLKLDGCLTGARLAKDRAADALTKVMIPEAQDYPI